MLIVIFLISIILIGLGLYFAYKSRWNGDNWEYENRWTIITWIFGFLILISVLIATPWLLASLLNCKNIENKIEFFENNNKELENKIYDVVEQYCIYEDKVMHDISTDKPELILLLYPELKSNELFNSYITTLRENNSEIKELTLQKLNEKVYKWWLYFGS